MDQGMDKVLEQGKYKCPSCGGQMIFDVGTQKLKCRFCGATKELEQVKESIVELDFHEYIEKFQDQAETVEVKTARCKNCGGEITFEPDAINLKCIYCGAAIVSEEKPHKVMKPQYLLPFKIKREKALQLFRKWIKKLWFAPNNLKKQASLTAPVQGIYYPYWTYDADTHSIYRGERGVRRTESYTETDSEGKTVTRQKTVTDWYPASGSVDLLFDDILIPAGESLEKGLSQDLSQWDLESLIKFDSSFTAGYHAQTYTIDMEQGYLDAKTIMENRIESSVRKDIGGDEQRIHSINSNFSNITFKYILLPIWTLVYKYGKKYFEVLVNGRTGEIKGKRPYSAWKIIGFTLLIAAIIGAVIYLAKMNGSL